MTNVAIKVVFQACLSSWWGASTSFESHTVSLGGAYPDIEIENLGRGDGLHFFKIRKTVPQDHGQNMIRSVAAEAEAEIEAFWNVLSYLRNSRIQPMGNVQYEHGGVLLQVEAPPEPVSGGMLSDGAGSKWFEFHAEHFHRPYDYDLLKRFNFARSLLDPVSKFLSLYAMLASVTNDQQSDIDRLIKDEEPTIAASLSPKTGRPETIFTRLRNELAHDRKGASVYGTHAEIRLHVGRFEWLVGRILGPRIEGATN